MAEEELPKLSWEEVKGKVGIIKQFCGKLIHKKTGKIALCQIQSCEKEASWMVTHNDKVLVLCFKHGEDA
jgi:hypothetical protein